MQYTFTTKRESLNKRLDQVVWEYLGEECHTEDISGLSRSRIAQCIREGGAVVGGKPVYNPAKRLRIGERIVFSTDYPQKVDEKNDTGEEMRILKEAEQYLIVDKPAGMLVYSPKNASKEEKTVVTSLIDRGYIKKENFSSELQDRPGIVHRLDRNTSGVMLVAKNQESLEVFRKMFQAREIKKEYLALTSKALPKNEGIIDTPIYTKKGSIKRFSQLYRVIQSKIQRTQRAITRYRLLRSFPDGSFYLVTLITGRTHQIRVHFASQHAPVWGDELYGGKNERQKKESRHYLHAWRLTFSFEGSLVQVAAPLPEGFQNLLISLDENRTSRYDNEALEKGITEGFS